MPVAQCPIRRWILTTIIAAATLGAGAPYAQQAPQQLIAIGTGGTGGVYYPLGGGMANLLSTRIPGLQATAEVTGASVDNLKFLRAGKIDVGFTMADTAWDAYQGQDKFKDAKVDVRTLLALYPNNVHVVTIDGTGIAKLADLKGKRLSTGSPGSGTEVIAFRLLDAIGLDKDRDITRERLSVAESVNALKDRKIDAMIWAGGVPTAAITDLAATPGVKIRLLDNAEAMDALTKKYGPLFFKSTIAAGSYPGQDKPVGIVSVWNLLVVDAKMPEQLAYNITKTLIENQPDLVKVHQEASNIALSSQGSASPIPYHPGAKRYFQEKSVTVR